MLRTWDRQGHFFPSQLETLVIAARGRELLLSPQGKVQYTKFEVGDRALPSQPQHCPVFHPRRGSTR